VSVSSMKADQENSGNNWWKHSSKGKASRNARPEPLGPAEISSSDSTPAAATPKPFAIIRINGSIIIVVGVSGPG